MPDGGGPDPFLGREVAGFRILEELGRGASGTVYRAVQTRLDREVALKILAPELASRPDVAARFAREGAAVAKLDHPAIVAVYVAGQAEGVSYLAMRLIRGATLQEILTTRGSALAPNETEHVVRCVAGALDHLHAAGLVHLDVKPSNILVEGSVIAPGAIFLTDLGIAQSVDDGSDLGRESMGTAWYMAPEQAEPGRVDSRADIYALGCVAYECATGRRPFSGETVVQVLMAHRTKDAPTTGDEALDALFRRALAKDPAGRFITAGELAAALGEALAASPSGGLPEGSRAHVAPRRVRRIIAAEVALVLLVGLVVVWAARLGGAPDGAPATVAVATTQRASGVAGTVEVATTQRVAISVGAAMAGPARLVDPVGVSYDLAAGERVSRVTASQGFSVLIARGDDVVAQAASRRGVTGGIDDPAFAADCQAPPVPAFIAGVPARHCPIASADSPPRIFEKWWAISGGSGYFFQLSPKLTPEERTAFLDAVSFP